MDISDIEKEFFQEIEKLETHSRILKSSINNNNIILEDLKQEILKSLNF